MLAGLGYIVQRRYMYVCAEAPGSFELCNGNETAG
jgi:hypothetical protein